MPESHDFNRHQYDFQALRTADGLARLDADFVDYLQACDPGLQAQLIAYRGECASFKDPATLSAFLIDLAVHMDAYLIQLFQIEDEAAGLHDVITQQAPIFTFKQHFVQKLAKRLVKKPEQLTEFKILNDWLLEQVDTTLDKELAIAQLAVQWLQSSAASAESIDRLAQWCAHALSTPEAQAIVHDWVSFRLPAKLDYDALVPVEEVQSNDITVLQGRPAHYRRRDGFALTDTRMSAREVLSEIDYCVYCHKNDGDFCSQGFPVKKREPELGLKVNPLDDTLTGCPLDEKISEMHTLKRDGVSLGALAVIMRDNPMCPATGHRICNDCMKACIYQKQDPVNIPEVETRILTDVLSLPWGVEIYDLLTRWNPLRQSQYCMQPYNGANVIVMGMGPAGFTMAHHLLMAGCAVLGCDGLKIEPLPDVLVNAPVRSFDALVESLDERRMTGFGGVAEYGITVRWDKNFLKLIYLTLLRRPYFQVRGNVRFGGTLTLDDAWKMGFHHLTISVGAGLPKELHVDHSLAPGMRQAADFLMALQLTGAAKEDSLANLQVRLPAVVIGGGLTGVDTATEVQAYYIKQVEKTVFRYETLVEKLGEASVRARFSPADLVVLDECCDHGRAVRECRQAALRAGEVPNFIPLLRQWGGVTIVYRRRMQDSPAYKRNHEELTKALEEGIFYAELYQPEQVLVDEAGACRALRCQQVQTEAQVDFPARSILVATGAKPNVAYAFEHRHDIERERFEYPRFKLVDGELERVTAQGHVKMADFGPFTSYQCDGRVVSFIGDTHPIFHGSVVKAIASAKRCYPSIITALQPFMKARSDAAYQTFATRVSSDLQTVVTEVIALSDDATYLTIRAPRLAQQHQPGQFYRLQNYEFNSQGPLAEGVALLGIQSADDCLSFVLFHQGVSAEILSTVTVGQDLAVMGPTGVRTIPADGVQSILMVGDHNVIPYTLAVAPLYRALGCQTMLWYVGDELPYLEEALTAVADVVHTAPFAEAHLPALTGQLPMDEVHVIGGANVLREAQHARASWLQPLLSEIAQFKGAVYGPMQCMLKGVCAQCLQWQVDPETGKRTKAVYACSWQHQPIELIDVDNLAERLSQNRLQETLTGLWYRTVVH